LPGIGPRGRNNIVGSTVPSCPENACPYDMNRSTALVPRLEVTQPAAVLTLFPPRRRAAVLGPFQAAGPLGTVLGMALGLRQRRPLLPSTFWPTTSRESPVSVDGEPDGSATTAAHGAGSRQRPAADGR
jgi:hypothetical protein